MLKPKKERYHSDTFYSRSNFMSQTVFFQFHYCYLLSMGHLFCYMCVYYQLGKTINLLN